jgi:FkbM family methyltransferase
VSKIEIIVFAFDAVRRSLGYRFPPLGRKAYALFFRLIPQRPEVELVPGVRVQMDFADATMRGTYWQGPRFEHPTLEILMGWTKSDATHFFDIGSNYGFFSYWLLSRSTLLEVHAFEPNPRTFATVESTKELNALVRFHPWNVGLSDVVTRLELHPGVVDSGHSTFGVNPTLSDETLAGIEVLTFDAWRRKIGLDLPGGPQWVAKIDVEGFETRVLRGMTEALTARAFAGLVVEVNEFTLGFCGSKPAEVYATLAEFGYRALATGQDSGNAFFVPA